MAEIPIGATGQVKLLVTSQVAIDFMGNDGARVLSTPHLVYQLEMAAYYAIKPYLDEGYDSLGTDVMIKHLAATPIGMSVTFKAEVIHVDGRRVNCRVEAFDEVEKIAEGTHERFVVNAERFAQRVREKGLKG